MAPTLKVTSGPAAGQSLELERELVIGRENADLTIDDAELSRRHVVLRPTGAGVEIEDLGSLNGTFVGDRRISEPTTLSIDTTIRIGTTQIAIEVPPVQATRPSPIPEPPAPDVTAPRKIPEQPAPDVTAPRKIPEQPAPDVTAPRKIPDAAPPAPAPAGEVPVAAPSDVTARREVPPGAVPPAPAAGPPEPGPPGPPRRPIGVVIAGAVAAIGVALIIIFLLAAFGPGTKDHDVDLRGEVRTVSQVQNKSLSRGTVTGEPRDSEFRLDVVLGGPPEEILRGPTPFSARALLTTPDGTVDAVMTGTVQPGGPGEGPRSEGTVTFTGGTGEFEAAEGEGTFVDDRSADPTGRRGELVVRGSFESEE